MLKRVFDFVFSFVMLLLVVPFLLLAVIGIKLTSRGPVLYRAKRIGMGRVPFTMYKFRTMHVNDGSGSAITAPGDARIFGFGGFLRATKIDELPQLFNILKGDMSFVGPRPEDPEIVSKHYNEWMLETLTVRPGLTSPGTLDYMRNFNVRLAGENTLQTYVEDVLPEKLRADLKYIDRQSFWGDMKLIIETALSVISKILRLSSRE